MEMSLLNWKSSRSSNSEPWYSIDSIRVTSFYTDKDYGQENAFMKLYRRRRTRKFRTALSCPCPYSGQIRTANRIRTETLSESTGQNLDSRHTLHRIFQKIRIKTRHGQDSEKAIRRRLNITWLFIFVISSNDKYNCNLKTFNTRDLN